jgi:hypothetical protein
VPNMILGFTGTRAGMTELQWSRIKMMLIDLRPSEVHHGDCIGADADFHKLIRKRNHSLRNKVRIVTHPPIKTKGRAYCKGDFEHPPFEYIKRDHDIVDASDMIFATPKGMNEELRSGTWATVRYAVRTGVPVIIIWPDGSTERR